MKDDGIAYLDNSGRSVPRIQKRRNRKDIIFRNDVVMDIKGNISHTPILGLACFANPIEYYRGIRDQFYSWKGTEQAHWCAGCRCRAACATVASRRVDEDSAIKAKLLAWEAAGQFLPGNERYWHSTFTDFATACNERGWTSDNDDMLAEKRAQDADRKRKQRAEKKRQAKKRKSVTPDALIASNDERNRRHSALLTAARSPKAPTWLRNLSDKTIVLTCDVWQLGTAIGARYRGEVTGGDIARALMELNRANGIAEQSVRVRVNEAIKRIDRLCSEPVQAPVWAAFEANQNAISPRSRGRLSNGVITMILDDIDDQH